MVTGRMHGVAGAILSLLCGWFLCMVGQKDWISAIQFDLERDKGIRWMPWHQEAMKDVARCEKPWGAASRL